MTRGRTGLVLFAAFLAAWFLPVGEPRFDAALAEGLQLVRWYAREHVILCLLPAFLIAGAISVFVRRESVLRYLGPDAPKPVAYGVASVAGSVLAVCSCTVLPLFAGIWRMGAGLGPASAFLYSGPAINVLAVLLTARVLGLELGVARTVGAVGFAFAVGLAMAAIFRREESARARGAPAEPADERGWPAGRTAAWIGLMVAVLVFANWSEAERGGFFGAVARAKWLLAALPALGIGLLLVRWFAVPAWKPLVGAAAVAALAVALPHEPSLAFAAGVVAVGWIALSTAGPLREWFDASWDFTLQIAPLLLGGVFVAGLLLGRPGHEGLVPSAWITATVGGNSLAANAATSVVGAFMYFATLTEIPILQGLLGSGMGKGPALTLLLAGPALSLPSLLVLRSVMGARKTLVYCALVVVFSTLAGWAFGHLVGGAASAPTQGLGTP